MVRACFRRDKRSSSPYSSNRPDKDERPPLLSLPIKEQHFHQGGPSPHHEQPHFNQGGSVSHHDQFAQGAPSKHPDQHYHQGSMGHEQYPQGPPPKSHHDGHYQQGPPPLVDQQYSQGPMPPHFRQHEQFDQHSPPLGTGEPFSF